MERLFFCAHEKRYITLFILCKCIAREIERAIEKERDRERERKREREITAELRSFENIFEDVATIHCDENDDNYVRDSGFLMFLLHSVAN